jgi:hypothetical protein
VSADLAQQKERLLNITRKHSLKPNSPNHNPKPNPNPNPDGNGNDVGKNKAREKGWWIEGETSDGFEYGEREEGKDGEKE